VIRTTTHNKEAIMQLVNCTPHVLNIVRKDGTVLNLKPSGIIPRVATTNEIYDEIDGVVISQTLYGSVQDLPEPEEGTYYIVSLLVKKTAITRDDLLAPGELIRNSEGQTVGCKGLNK
jgi:hypothetical protein